MTLSIIVPVYNEEKTISHIIDTLQKIRLLDLKKEIIVVNDASTDKTSEKLAKFSGTIKLVNHRKNLGKGAAISSGLKKSTGDYVIVQDADLEYNPKEMEILLIAAKYNPRAVIYGSRFRGKHEDAVFGHKFGNLLLTFLTNLLYGSQLSDMETCYKLIPANALSGIKIESSKFNFEPEITAKLLKKRLDILEVPISYNKRGFTEGKKIHWLRDGISAVWTLLKYRIRD